ncbi:hypothetical protein [Microbacterium sp. CFBP9034]|uniref:hypothetical protein n=1 Tax=Microbacterium sp. CFBP9034 TaxID=3096540 RepID=UPI002A6B2D1B|nr:hypothetical protein [Microbacterium sp. CFBP9034]MDY0909992.1 hypothetical protein [Microbacterium sp. CFBP9034]
MPTLLRTASLVAGGLPLAAVLLSGCATGGGAPGGYGQAPAADETPGAPGPGVGPNPPEAFTTRPELPSCGHIELNQGDDLPQEAIDCLADAGAPGAELVVTAPTVEGDPVITYYRALPGGGIEVFTDMTQDAYGGGWWHSSCPEATGIDDLATCTDIPVD